MLDPDRETGPTALARLWEVRVSMLTAERDAVASEDRKAVNQQLKTARQMLRFCKTRAGYRGYFSEGQATDKSA